MIQDALKKLVRRQDLTREESAACMVEMLEAKASPAQVGAYLSLLAAKGETVDEVVGAMRVMREHMVRLSCPDPDAVDVCGTGGDHAGTFNISTASALVLAGGGVTVAKHGNRAASSMCGSAEVLQELGVRIDAPPPVLERCLAEARIAFLFAPAFHPAMKNVGPIRKELGLRTLFNILGPLCNPAGVKRQVVGVFDAGKARLMARALVEAGSVQVVTLHSRDGLDEVSCAGATDLFEMRPGWKAPEELTLYPEVFGFARWPVEQLAGGDAAVNAGILRGLLSGRETGPRRDAVVMSAALGFYVSGRAHHLQDGIVLAKGSLDSGAAARTLERLVAVSKG
jgi:anthranilate phosphoribosyltransferase